MSMTEHPFAKKSLVCPIENGKRNVPEDFEEIDAPEEPINEEI